MFFAIVHRIIHCTFRALAVLIGLSVLVPGTALSRCKYVCLIFSLMPMILLLNKFIASPIFFGYIIVLTGLTLPLVTVLIFILVLLCPPSSQFSDPCSAIMM